MKRKVFDTSLERMFLTGLATSTPFLSAASSVLDLGFVDSQHFRLIAKWSLDYFRQYGEAPGDHIHALFRAWQAKFHPPDSESDPIEAVIDNLPDPDDKLNVPFLLDQLGTFMTKARLQRASDNLTSALAENDMPASMEAITNVVPANMSQETGVDLLNDRGVWKRAFAEAHEPLITYGGAAGLFFNPVLMRDGLIGVQAPEKTGKTFWCMELAHAALANRLRVAFFQVGDLTEHQFMKRWAVRLSGRPLQQRDCGEVEVPRRITIARDAEGKAVPSVDKKIERKSVPVDYMGAYKAARRFLRKTGVQKDSKRFITSTHPICTVNVADIDSLLHRWKTEWGFVADVIIIDYADILAPEDGSKEERHQVNDTWKALRRLSQQWHALVITPTQAKATSYTAKRMGKQHFSEDKRKLAHVTGMLGLNQTEEEKELGIMRLNWIAVREAASNPAQCLYVAQCLKLGRAMCCAALG